MIRWQEFKLDVTVQITADWTWCLGDNPYGQGGWERNAILGKNSWAMISDRFLWGTWLMPWGSGKISGSSFLPPLIKWVGLDFHPTGAARRWVIFDLISQVTARCHFLYFECWKAKSYWPPSALGSHLGFIYSGDFFVIIEWFALITLFFFFFGKEMISLQLFLQVSWVRENFQFAEIFIFCGKIYVTKFILLSVKCTIQWH